jgi:acyl-CoA thioesterase YciA
MPADTNANGDIFGGWLLAQMDIAGGITSSAYSGGRVATVGVEAMEFHKPVLVGDVVSVYAELLKTGRTSMTYRIQAWVERGANVPVQVTQGIFTYVSIERSGVSKPLSSGTR